MRASLHYRPYSVAASGNEYHSVRCCNHGKPGNISQGVNVSASTLVKYGHGHGMRKSLRRPQAGEPNGVRKVRGKLETSVGSYVSSS